MDGVTSTEMSWSINLLKTLPLNIYVLDNKLQLRIQFGVLPPYQNAKIRDLAQGSGR